jgi:thioredoxin 1
VITHSKGITPAELEVRLALPSPTLLVVYLWGPDCPNCVVFKRCLPKLLAQLIDVDAALIELDVYAYPDVATRYGVMGIPHFLLFKGGKRLGKMSEFRGTSHWANVVRENA